ncbi:MAG: hypothetical protein M3010_09905 [Candidatus Dormibacteraeota bacterium]|nr:hypothetical protein [Candidatus Dormibacteraeota bacterium]
MTASKVAEIESASALRRGIEVWYAVFGGLGAWIVHLVFLLAAEHWTYTHHLWSWTLHAVTVVTVLATVAALLLCWRLLAAARGADASGRDDAGQLLFLAQLGLLVGAINLALILLEGSYVLFLPRS